MAEREIQVLDRTISDERLTLDPVRVEDAGRDSKSAARLTDGQPPRRRNACRQPAGARYPRGLTCDETLLGARIIAVADVTEAMMSHRPYRSALGVEAALAEIESGAGSLYDPDVARVCVSLFREHGFELS